MPPKQALIIDDNLLNIEVLTLMLKKEGVESAAVESLRQVPEMIDSLANIDVIFLDLEFPHANGFDALSVLKADTRLKNSPIVAYTVHTSEIDRVRHAGFDSFIGKPLNSEHFPDQLRRILSGIPVWEV